MLKDAKNAKPKSETPQPTTQPDPFGVPTSEAEPSNPATEEPNPLGPAATAPQQPQQKPSPQSQPQPEPPEKPLRVSTDQARPAVRAALRFAAAMLDPDMPPTDDEVQAIAEPAAEGLPAWVFHWSLRLGGAVLEFVSKRLASRAATQAKAQTPKPEAQPSA